MQYCAERVDQGPALADIRARLAARARKFGYHDTAVEPPVVWLEQTGFTQATVAPGTRELHLLAETGRADGDRRMLGALVVTLHLDGAEFVLTDPSLTRGFHAPEHHGPRLVRWTNGEAVIAIDRSSTPRQLMEEVGAMMALRRAS